MSDNTEQAAKDKKQNKSVIVVLLIIVIVILIGGISAAAVLVSKNISENKNKDSEYSDTPVLAYAEGAVALDADGLQDQVDEMVEKAEDGMMTLEFKNTAVSTDGTNFTCHIGNAIENKYDMYINIFLDDNLEDEILLTGLLSPGMGIDSFESEKKLNPGNYQ
jgi:ABC-type Na+ efflux pump permease subunit